MSDPAFDVLADAVERAAHRYRHADAQQVDQARAKAELVAICDVLATSERCRPEPDPVPSRLVERTLESIRDHIAQRRTPELCDCACHSGIAGRHTPICWLRRHTTEGKTRV